MFESVLHPLDRRAGLAGRQAHQHRVRKHRLLDAKAAAGIARGLVAQPVGRHLERHRHHRMQRERPHEIGGDVVAFVTGQELGNHHAAFDRRAGVARIVRGQRDPVRRGGKGGLWLAVAEVAVAHHIGAYAGMQDGRIVGQRSLDRYHRRQHAVIHPHQVERVFGQCTALGHYHGHRLAHIAHAVHGQRPLLHWRLHGDHEGARPGCQVGAGQHGMHARRGKRGGGIDGAKFGMCMRGTHDGRVQGARLHAQVVAIAATAGEDRGVLEPLHRAADVTLARGRAGGCGFKVDGRRSGGQAALVAHDRPSRVAELARSIWLAGIAGRHGEMPRGTGRTPATAVSSVVPVMPPASFCLIPDSVLRVGPDRRIRRGHATLNRSLVRLWY